MSKKAIIVLLLASLVFINKTFAFPIYSLDDAVDDFWLQFSIYSSTFTNDFYFFQKFWSKPYCNQWGRKGQKLYLDFNKVYIKNLWSCVYVENVYYSYNRYFSYIYTFSGWKFTELFSWGARPTEYWGGDWLLLSDVLGAYISDNFYVIYYKNGDYLWIKYFNSDLFTIETNIARVSYTPFIMWNFWLGGLDETERKFIYIKPSQDWTDVIQGYWETFWIWTSTRWVIMTISGDYVSYAYYSGSVEPQNWIKTGVVFFSFIKNNLLNFDYPYYSGWKVCLLHTDKSSSCFTDIVDAESLFNIKTNEDLGITRQGDLPETNDWIVIINDWEGGQTNISYFSCDGLGWTDCVVKVVGDFWRLLVDAIKKPVDWYKKLFSIDLSFTWCAVKKDFFSGARTTTNPMIKAFNDSLNNFWDWAEFTKKLLLFITALIYTLIVFKNDNS